MSGRHRQAQTGMAQQALAGALPVLGVAGAATGLVLSSGAAVVPPAAGIDPVDQAAEASAAPSIRQDVPGRGTDAVSAVSDASAALRQQAGQTQQQSQSVDRIVEDIRADARARDAAAVREGRAELDAFQQEQAQARQDATQPDSQAPSRSMPEQDVFSTLGECDLDGLPRIGSIAGPNEIVNRDCGLTDATGQDRSQDPWIDGQLLADDDD